MGGLGATLGKTAGGGKDQVGVSGKSPMGRGKKGGHTMVTLEDVKSMSIL